MYNASTLQLNFHCEKALALLSIRLPITVGQEGTVDSGLKGYRPKTLCTHTHTHAHAYDKEKIEKKTIAAERPT